MTPFKPSSRTPNLDVCCIGPEETIATAIARIDSNAKGIVLVVDGQRHLLGTITDGDVRRALLSKMSLDLPLTELLARKSATAPTAPVRPLTAPSGTDDAQLLHLMNENALRHLPLIDDDGKVVDLAVLSEMARGLETSLRAVVMAGGFGTRLRPLTEDTPKPMLPVGDKPLLEHTVDRLRHAGIRHVAVTTHYKSEKITAHFGDGQKFGVDISYVHEDQPLGTAGALGLIEHSDDTLLVINGDVLTNLDFRAMVAFHHSHDAALTVGVRQYEIKVPYGVVECDDVRVIGLTEKPVYTVLVNAGIYLVSPAAHAAIPSNQRLDMTELMERLMADGRTVVSFPICEYWLDIGQRGDYEQAQTDFDQGRVQAQEKS